MRRAVLIISLIVLTTSGAWAFDSLRRIDDTRLMGRVTAVDMRKGVTISVAKSTGQQTVTVPFDEVLTLRFGSVSKKTFTGDDRIVLAGGERYRVRVLGSEGTQLTLGSGNVLTGKNAVRYADLRAFVPFREVKAGEPAEPEGDETEAKEEPPPPPSPEKLEAQLLALENEQDLLLMKNGDRLAGIVESVGPKEVVLSSKLGRVSVPAPSVTGIAFSKTLKPWSEPKGLLAEVHLVDGSMVLGQIAGPAGGKYTLTSVMGPKWQVDASHIRRLNVRGGKLVWLSDIETAEVKLTPFFNRTWEVRRNRSVWGAPLRVGGKTYDRGLGVHARTELTYEIGGGFVFFVAELAVDDETNKTGTVAFSVLGDGRTLLKALTVSGGDKPKPVKVNVKGIKRLTLIADFAGDDDIGDHADWLNARLVRE